MAGDTTGLLPKILPFSLLLPIRNKSIWNTRLTDPYSSQRGLIINAQKSRLHFVYTGNKGVRAKFAEHGSYARLYNSKIARNLRGTTGVTLRDVLVS